MHDDHCVFVYEHRPGLDHPHIITCRTRRCTFGIAQRVKGNCHTAAIVHMLRKRRIRDYQLREPTIVGWRT